MSRCNFLILYLYRILTLEIFFFKIFVANSCLLNYINNHVLLERYGSLDAPKEPLLSHDVLSVRFRRHILQRVRLLDDADIFRESSVVL